MSHRRRTMPCRRLTLVALAALFGTIPARGAAQTGASPTYGVRMRVVDSAGAETTGRLLSWRADSLVLDVGGEARSFDAARLARADAHAGSRSQAWRGARIGALAGFIAGVAIGMAAGDDDPDQWFAMTAGEKALYAGTGLGLLGTGIGAGIGAASRVDRWEPVALSDQRMIRGSGTRIGARIDF